jgi:hypothetical protein
VIAALYVEKGGCYSQAENVEIWDVERDARKYAGPWPVVAHPPCQLWINYAALNFKRWGGEHNRPGNDGGCFKHALDAVNQFGGVLEHPAFSKAWNCYGLHRPPRDGGWMADPFGACGEDERRGFVCEVWQSAYGHRARKRTWLYASLAPSRIPELNWSREPGTHQCGYHDQRGKNRNKPTLSKKEASATPLPFRDLLLDIARSVLSRQSAPSIDCR